MVKKKRADNDANESVRVADAVAESGVVVTEQEYEDLLTKDDRN